MSLSPPIRKRTACASLLDLVLLLSVPSRAGSCRRRRRGRKLKLGSLPRRILRHDLLLRRGVRLAPRRRRLFREFAAQHLG